MNFGEEPRSIYPSTNLRLLSGLYIACDVAGFITPRTEVTRRDHVTSVPRVDYQGLQFTDSFTSISRERYQQLRQRHYENYRNTERPRDELKIELSKLTAAAQPYYRFRYASLGPTERCYVAHFQLRNLLSASSANQLYYVHSTGLRRWSASAYVSRPVIDLRSEDSLILPTTLAARDDLVFLGGLKGDYFLRNVATGVSSTGQLSPHPNGILNYAELAYATSGAPLTFVASNDGHIRTLDITASQVVADYRFDCSVNCASVSPDGQTLAMVGDSCESYLLDPQTGKIRATLTGHLDYSFACAWSPNGRYLVTGNQDRTARVYDVRYHTRALHVLPGRMASVRTLRFSPDGRYLAVGESTDYVHLVDVVSDFQHAQTVDFFGDVAGVTFTPDSESCFIGVRDNQHGSPLIHLERGHHRSDLAIPKVKLPVTASTVAARHPTMTRPDRASSSSSSSSRGEDGMSTSPGGQLSSILPDNVLDYFTNPSMIRKLIVSSVAEDQVNQLLLVPGADTVRSYDVCVHPLLSAGPSSPRIILTGAEAPCLGIHTTDPSNGFASAAGAYGSSDGGTPAVPANSSPADTHADAPALLAARSPMVVVGRRTPMDSHNHAAGLPCVACAWCLEAAASPTIAPVRRSLFGFTFSDDDDYGLWHRLTLALQSQARALGMTLNDSEHTEGTPAGWSLSSITGENVAASTTRPPNVITTHSAESTTTATTTATTALRPLLVPGQEIDFTYQTEPETGVDTDTAEMEVELATVATVTQVVARPSLLRSAPSSPLLRGRAADLRPLTLTHTTAPMGTTTTTTSSSSDATTTNTTERRGAEALLDDLFTGPANLLQEYHTLFQTLLTFNPPNLISHFDFLAPSFLPPIDIDLDGTLDFFRLNSLPTLSLRDTAIGALLSQWRSADGDAPADTRAGPTTGDVGQHPQGEEGVGEMRLDAVTTMMPITTTATTPTTHDISDAIDGGEVSSATMASSTSAPHPSSTSLTQPVSSCHHNSRPRSEHPRRSASYSTPLVAAITIPSLYTSTTTTAPATPVTVDHLQTTSLPLARSALHMLPSLEPLTSSAPTPYAQSPLSPRRQQQQYRAPFSPAASSSYRCELYPNLPLTSPTSSPSYSTAAAASAPLIRRHRGVPALVDFSYL
ncbi:hypothetical protein IWQ60_011375 [Tieghemiomyces parasiticus]|uniref:DUF2415 domain-containing protein n=1 Tax=Tieghemiomyces parasiticus TaxID=78921 RepID=A0A9W7ZNF2_9FUNG|nr:hypothetical protein IWQ60_011375 [Tieghemiomyces parasiticus]